MVPAGLFLTLRNFIQNSRLMGVRKEQIDDFLKSRKFAIAGVSRNKGKFGNQVFEHLSKNGYEIIPINPFADEINGVKCLKSVEELPGEIDSLLLATPKSESNKVLEMALKNGIKNIWIQQGGQTAESLEIAAKHEQEIITGKCIFMFAEPVNGIHKFHRFVAKVFNQLPK